MNIIAGNNIKQRLASIDAFRGLTIAGMIIVLNPGSWKYVYPAFKHADWHGWTIADLVFPFFLFIVGVSITFSLSKIKIDNLEKLFNILKPDFMNFYLIEINDTCKYYIDVVAFATWKNCEEYVIKYFLDRPEFDINSRIHNTLSEVSDFTNCDIKEIIYAIMDHPKFIFDISHDFQCSIIDSKHYKIIANHPKYIYNTWYTDDERYAKAEQQLKEQLANRV